MKHKRQSIELQSFYLNKYLICLLSSILAFVMQPEPNYSSEKSHAIEEAQEKLPELAKRFLDALQKKKPEAFQRCWASFELLNKRVISLIKKEQYPTGSSLRKIRMDLKYRDKRIKRIYTHILKRFNEHHIDLKTLKVFEASGDIETPIPHVVGSSNIRLRFKNDAGTIVEFNKLSGGVIEGQWYLVNVPSEFAYIRNGKRERVQIPQRDDFLPIYRPPANEGSDEGHLDNPINITYLSYDTVDPQMFRLLQIVESKTKKTRVTIQSHASNESSEITDANFNGIFEVKIPNVKSILCHNTGITDLTLAKVNQHFSDTLEELYVPSTAISDQGILFLKDCDQLKSLNLCGTKISNQCGSQISKYRNLEKLFLRETRITNEFMKSLQNLKKLHSLYLDDTDISNAGVQHLKALDSLVTLSLNNTLIGDESISYLKDMKTLKVLDLKYTQISDDAVKHLKNMKFLTTLYVRRTNLTREAVAQLIKQLPTTAIFSDY